MIHSLLKTNEDVQSFNTMLIFVVIFIAVVCVVHIGLLMYFRIKSHKLYDVKRDNTKKIESGKLTKTQEKKVNEELDKSEHDIKLIDSRNKTEYSIFKSVMCILVVTFTILTLARVYFATGIGGKVSDIHKVNDVCNNGVCVEAYYTVRYNGVDQETMTIFVRNTLPVTVKTATIKEHITNKTVQITDLDKDEERILSFEIYPQEGYRFEVESFELKTNEEAK